MSHLLSLLNCTACLVFGLTLARGHRIAPAPALKPNAQRPTPNAPNSEQQELDRLYEKGVRAFDSASYSEAEQAFRTGLARAEKQYDPDNTARFANRLGKLYAYANAIYADAYNKARTYYMKAYTILKRNDRRAEMALCLENIGHAYRAEEQYDRALDYYAQALEIRQQIGKQAESADSFVAMGDSYAHLGQFERALDCFVQVQKLSKSLEQIATSIFQQGLLNALLHRYDKALSIFGGARALAHTFNRAVGVAACDMGLGLTYWYMEDYARARDAFVRALDYYGKPSSDPLFAAFCHAGLAMTYADLGQSDEAQQQINKADAGLGRHSFNIALSKGIHGVIYEGLGRFEEAEQAYLSALHIVEARREQIGDASQLDYLLNLLPHSYARIAAVQLKRNRRPDALLTLERGRGRGLAKQASQNHIGLERFLKPQEVTELKRRHEAYVAANSRLHAAQSRSVPPDAEGQQRLAAELAEATTRYKEAEHRLARFRDSLHAKYPQYGRLQGADLPTSKSLLALANRHPDTLYLEYAMVDNRTTLLFVLGKGHFQSFLLPVGEKALSQKVSQWRDALLNRGPKEKEYARDLYNALLAPVMQGVGRWALGVGENLIQEKGKRRKEKAQSPNAQRPIPNTHLVVVADGPLLDVPFAALLDEKDRRLIERYACSSSVSLGILSWPDDALKPSASLLCAADPLGGTDRTLPHRRVRGGGFVALPQAREEGRAVAKLFPQPLALFGGQARESVLKREMGKYSILHFATHGLLDSGNGLRSSLALAPEPEDSPEDGLLEAREIAERELSARLAVLSACETAQGQKVGGEGLLGLAWAFRAAGVPAIVASQWSVEDSATRKLMVAFYKALKAHARKDEALRAAMLAVKKEKPEPFYWAAFQVIGETGPLLPFQAAKTGRPK